MKKTHVIILVILVILIGTIYTFAKYSPKVDSLISKLSQLAGIEDTNKVNTLNALAWQLIQNSPRTSEYYAVQAFNISKKLHYDKGLAYSYKNLGAVYSIKNDYKKSFDYYSQAIFIFNQLFYATRNKNYMLQKAYLYNNIAINFKQQGKIDKALDYYFKSLRIVLLYKDNIFLPILFSNIGNLHLSADNYSQALYYYEKARRMSINQKNLEREISVLSNMAYIYKEQKSYSFAIEYLDKVIKVHANAGNNVLLMPHYISLGEVYKEKGNIDKAKFYFNKAYELSMKCESKTIQGMYYNNIGSIFSIEKDYTNALTYYKKAIAIFLEVCDNINYAKTLVNIADLYYQTKNIPHAVESATKALNLAKENKYKRIIRDATEVLRKCSIEQGDVKQAYEYAMFYRLMNDSLFNEALNNKLTEIEFNVNIKNKETLMELQRLKIEKQEAELVSKKNNQKIFITGIVVLSILLLVVILLTIVLYIKNKEKRRSNQVLAFHNKIISAQKLEITEQSAALEKINKELSHKNKLITNSITYARRIQEAVLPSNDLIKKYFPNSFVLSKPRDIVSGDFYWLSEYDDKIILSIIDCTGHGVPGAFMSLIANTLLNEIVNAKDIVQPSQILLHLNKGIINALHQNQIGDESQNDGMEIAVCVFDKKNSFIQFAATNQLLIRVRNQKLETIFGDPFPIGGDFMNDEQVTYFDHKIDIQENDMIYLSTDGYIDQFGGPDNKKFMLSHFKNTLAQIATLPVDEQLRNLDDTFENWKGTKQQTDDVLIIGIKI